MGQSEATNTDAASLIVRPSYDVQLREFERGLLSFLAEWELPTANIFVPLDERFAVFGNMGAVIVRIDTEHKQRSIYISKFLAAAASGLFDAALNYLWDETIFELRRRVAQYDLSYFFDNAVRNEDKRKRLSTEDDLTRIEDSELILGAKEIGLISELGYKHLDFIRYNRNWASAAHPNQNEVTGLQLVTWLQTCVREVISLPLSDVAVRIKRLLANVRDTPISEIDAREIATFFVGLTQEQVNTLASGFFGMYTRLDTLPQTRQNIRHLLPLLWDRVDEATRYGFGTKYAHFVADGDRAEKDLARAVVQTASALSYVPDSLRVAEIETAVDNLLFVHREFNNFHSEPSFARQLQRLIGSAGAVPPQVRTPYVLGLVEVFLTNGHGVTWTAEPIYRELLDQFDAEQALTAILSFTHTTIASRLQFSLCQTKFRELLDVMAVKVSASAVKELIEAMRAYDGPLDRMREDIRIKRPVEYLRKILGPQAVGSM